MRKKKQLIHDIKGYEGTKVFSLAHLEHENLRSFIASSNYLVMELAMGKGKFITELAQMFPKKQFIGVEVKEERVYSAVQKSIKKGLSNIIFLNINIDNIEEVFQSQIIDEIWINFPDPWPKKRHIKRRLVSSQYQEKYKKILKKDGIIHLKTDSENLYLYTQEILSTIHAHILFKTEDFSKTNYPIKIISEYEEKFLKKGITTKYIEWKY